jgi:hypothetical protein
MIPAGVVIPSGLELGLVTEDLLVAASADHTKLAAFDFKTQKWSDLVPGPIPRGVSNWAYAPDFKYVYYTTGGADSEALRVRLADHKVETIASLKDLPRAIGPDSNSQISVAPDGSRSSPATPAPRKFTPSR